MRMASIATLMFLGIGHANADGCFVMSVDVDERAAGKTGVASTEQKGVIIQLPEGREALLLQTTYHGPADRFAWVIPVPGKPARDDVFLAEPALIETLLERTAPEVKTEITDPLEWRRRHMMEEQPMGGVPPSAAGDEEGGAEPVTVHERFEFGDFDATVLSATRADVLTDWLHENGYQVPAESAEVFGHYVRKQWCFVALKMQPGSVEQRPVLDDVDPVGIRFETDELVYPLYISRVSSRQKTGMLLLVLSEMPVRCDQLPDARLPLEKRHRKGACYATIRRETVDRAEPALVCEYRGPGGSPFVDLYYEKGTWNQREGRDWRIRNLWATRYWTLLDREEMEDLTFSPSDDESATRLEIRRKGEIHRSLAERLEALPSIPVWAFGLAGAGIFLLAAWAANRGYALRLHGVAGATAVALALIVLLMIFGVKAAWLLLAAAPLLALTATRRVSDGAGPGNALTTRDMLSGAFVAAGATAAGVVAYRLLDEGASALWDDGPIETLLRVWRGDSGAGWALFLIAAQAAWVLLALNVVRKGLSGAGVRIAWLALPLFAMIGAILIAETQTELLGDIISRSTPHLLPLLSTRALLGRTALCASGLVLVTLLALLSHLLVAPWLRGGDRRFVQPLAHTLVILALIAILVSMVGLARAYAGTGGYLPSGVHSLDRALQQLDFMLEDFHQANGCYPARLEDMLGLTVPEAGVDSSGNPAPIIREPHNRDEPSDGVPPIEQLPYDPLTGRSDTWLYEPTGAPMVDSGGYEITLGETEFADPDQVRAFLTGGPQADLAATWKSELRYWQPAGSEPRHPFPYREDAVFNQDRLPTDRTILRAWEPTAQHSGRPILADPRAGTAFIGDDLYRVSAFAWAPDRYRFIYAGNAEPMPWLLVSHVFDRGKPRHVLTAPWPMEIVDLAWHPTEDRWLLVASEMDAEDEATCIYVLTRGGVPQRIAGPAPYRRARFSPDGESVLAVKGAPWAQPQWSGRGALVRIGLDGVQQVIDDEVAQDPFVEGDAGCALVRAHEGVMKAVLLIDRSGRAGDIRLPYNTDSVPDVWVGPDEIIAALKAPSGGLGELWRYDLPSGPWALIGRWQISERSSRRPPRNLVIVGRDPETRGVVVVYDRREWNAFVIRDHQPRLEVLGGPSYSAKRGERVQVRLGGEDIPALVEGIYWRRAFRPGDLLAARPGTDAPTDAAVVTSMDGAT